MTDTAPPLVSVVMPLYNPGKFLPAAIESILNQTLRDFEFIAVDDGSTDDSLAVLNRYAATDARLRIISRPNTGVSRAANDGINAATGELIARMDADDVSTQNRFTLQVKFLQDHPECDGVSGAILFADPEMRPIRTVANPRDHEEIDRRNLLGIGGTFVQGCSMIRKQAILQAGAYKDRYKNAEDLDLFLRLAEHGRLANLPDVLLVVRRHMASLSNARAKEQNELTWAAVRDAYERRGLAGPVLLNRPQEGAECPPHRLLRQWVTESASSGHRDTAKVIAIELLKSKPFWPQTWGAMSDAFLGQGFTGGVRAILRGRKK